MTVAIEVDPGRISAIAAQLDACPSGLTLDFSNVPRVDTRAIADLECLATAAHEKSVRLTLRGVNIDIYRVLKLLNLTPRFTFE